MDFYKKIMKKAAPVFLVMIISLHGCGSSKKQLEKGNYDAAIEKAVKQLRKDPRDARQIAILDRSFRIANEQDDERIRFLKMESRPASWDEIYLLNKRLSDRQSLVRSVTPLELNGKSISYDYIDYMPERIAAKRKSADYYYAHGNELMKNNLKESFRQAYYEFVRAKEYVGDYENIDNKIEESRYLGMSRVMISLINKSILKFTPEFEEDLLALDLPRLNSEWVEYHIMNYNNNLKYDYFININVKTIAVSPDQTMQRDSVIKRDVEDGFNYKLDSRGNVMKDSLGNDIKTKRYKTLQCALIETIQSKTCVIEGDIEILQSNPGKLLKKEPLGARSQFENISARAVGDIGALNNSQLQKTRTKPLPFPDDMEMIFRCSESLKQAINAAVQSNRRLIN